MSQCLRGVVLVPITRLRQPHFVFLSAGESMLGSALVNGFNANSALTGGGLAGIASAAAKAGGPISAAVALGVSIVSGLLDAQQHPGQGGSCPANASPVSVDQIDQFFYNATGMSPMEWASTSGLDGTGGTIASSVVIVGGIPPARPS